MKRFSFVCAAFLAILIPSVCYAQTTCSAAPPPGTVIDANTLFADLPEHTATTVDGSALVTDYVLAYFKVGEDPNTAPPTQGPSTVQKSSFTLESGTCYKLAVIPSIPVTGVTLFATVKSHHAASTSVPELTSAWAAGSNPFAKAPNALTAPGRPVMKKQ